MTSSTEVTIRPADSSDFDWVAAKIVSALTPYYGGDHWVHAERIFTAHIMGGVDHVGHFSSGQHMFVAIVNGKRAGILHLVDKKQSTVKISPLIVDAKFRGYGVGSALLRHAEHYALTQGVRQLYCTVAAPNEQALGFFLNHGFYVTGTAHEHYKPGINEHMLYKPLAGDSDLSTPHVSVVPFVPKLHGERVRSLILSQMHGDFLGVDDAWVEALYAGYARRASADVNTKFKVMFVTEQGGEVTGVVGATPKKGDPIKLMPLVAINEAAFEALVIDLKELLADYGHKLYVHLVPKAWQVACLQRHGWQLEGVFPGGYAPDSIVQQWGLTISQAVTIRTLRVKRPYYDAIMTGQKTHEVRVGYAHIQRYQAGELIRLETSQVSGLVRLKAVRVYQSISQALAIEPWERIVPHASSPAEALDWLKQIYPPHKEKLGVYVFELEPVTNKP